MKIIAYRERTWFSGEHEDNTDFALWDQLCSAFNVPFQLIDDWSQAIIPNESKIYLFEEDGQEDFNNHTIDISGVYVFGKTHLNIMNVVPTYEQSIKIVTPQPICLFGVSAASILLGKTLWP